MYKTVFVAFKTELGECECTFHDIKDEEVFKRIKDLGWRKNRWYEFWRDDFIYISREVH